MRGFKSLELLVGPKLVKMDTFMKEVIPAREGLTIT